MAHPNAADSLEGIAKWWLTRQRFETSVKLVQRALDRLVAQGVLYETTTPGGKSIYGCKLHS